MSKTTQQMYAQKRLQKAVSGGVIINPDVTVEALNASVQAEVANLRDLRVDIIKCMVTGLAPAIANGDVKKVDANDLVESADNFARALLRMQCEEVEAVLAVTGGKRTPGFEYVSSLLGVQPHPPMVSDKPEVVKDEKPVNLHG